MIDSQISHSGWSDAFSDNFYARNSNKVPSPQRRAWKAYSPRKTNIHNFSKFQSPKRQPLMDLPNFKDKNPGSPMTDIMKNLKNLIESPVLGRFQKSPGASFSRAPGTRNSPIKKQVTSFSLTPIKAKLKPLFISNPRNNSDDYYSKNISLPFGQSKKKSVPVYTPTCLTWTGTLPPKDGNDNKYSRKVFLGGVPWDITNENLEETFSRFGSLTVEWPPIKNGQKPKGYVYIVFDDATSVNKLLEFCRSYSAKVFPDFSDGTMYKYHVRSEKMNSKEIQVIPWNLNDSTKVIGPQDKVNMHHQVFVGGLHGMLTATGLSKVMNDLFGSVVYVEIDIDKYKYPLGSGRVNFSSLESYQQAIQGKYVQVKCLSPKVDKRIQIDPYIRENENCSKCLEYPGPIYCRKCLDYFCEDCWDWHMRDFPIKHERVCRTRNGKAV